MTLSRLEKAYRAWVLLMQTRDAIYKARSKELYQYGISPRESAILHAISSIGEEATPIKVARWTYRKPHTTTGILHRMQNRNLIKLAKDTKMKKLVRISLTEEGMKAYKDSRKRASIQDTFESYTDEDFLRLEDCLTKIRDKALKQTGDSIHRPYP